jgi:hypothetical protein
VTEDIMDQMRRWSGQAKPEVLPIGEWLHWVICRQGVIVNEVTRWPNVEF